MRQIYKEDVTKSLFVVADLIRHRILAFVTPSFVLFYLFFEGRKGIVVS